MVPVAHDNLEAVSQVLVERYQAASKLAKNRRDLEFEQEKQEMNGDYDQEEIDRMITLISDEKNVAALDVKVDALKNIFEVQKNLKQFEKYLDEGIDLAALTENEIRLLRKDLKLSSKTLIHR